MEKFVHKLERTAADLHQVELEKRRTSEQELLVREQNENLKAHENLRLRNLQLEFNLEIRERFLKEKALGLAKFLNADIERTAPKWTLASLREEKQEYSISSNNEGEGISRVGTTQYINYDGYGLLRVRYLKDDSYTEIRRLGLFGLMRNEVHHDRKTYTFDRIFLGHFLYTESVSDSIPNGILIASRNNLQTGYFESLYQLSSREKYGLESVNETVFPILRNEFTDYDKLSDALEQYKNPQSPQAINLNERLESAIIKVYSINVNGFIKP